MLTPRSRADHTPITRSQVIAMLRLLTFGGLRVLRGDGSATELANQRRRIAVLAVVAAAAPSGVSRDRLLFLLWPNSDEEKGRHALTQIVYNLRRELGTSPIDGAVELSLLQDVMTADLVDFRAAIARHDHAAAAALYTGPFLDGFFVPGAGEFDRWAEDERMRTLRQAIASIDKLAAAAHDSAELMRWTARLVELDPLSARRALTHMRALADHGDRDAAIAYGRRYDALARSDGDDVDAAVGAEVDRLRTMPTILPNPVSASAMLSPPAVAATISHDAAVSPAHDSSHTAQRAGTRWWIPMTVAVSLAIGSAAAWNRIRTPTLPLEPGDRLLLADVSLSSADSSTGRALAFALQSALQQSARVRFVSPVSITDALRRMGRLPITALPDSTAVEVAEREGARYVIALAITPSGASRLLTLRVIDPIDRSTLHTYSATASPNSLLPAIDAVAGQLRSHLGDNARDIASAIPLPRATTPSLEALKLLASGRDAFSRSMYQDASALFANALALDSGFAAAHAGLASVDYTMNNIVDGDAHMARALALADRLPPRERLLIEAVAARGRGDWARAGTLHRAYLIRYPDDYDIYGLLGYDLMMAKNPEESLSAYDSLLAHRRAISNVLINVAAAYRQLGRSRDARKAQVQATHLDTGIIVHAIQNEEFGQLLLELGFADSARAVHALMLTRSAQDQARGHRSMAYVDLYEGRYRSAVTHLDAAIEKSRLDPRLGLSVVRDRALLANTLLDLGDTTTAQILLREAASQCIARAHDPSALFWTGKPLARLGSTSLAQLLLDSAHARTRATDSRQVAATRALEAEVLIARGRFAEGIAAAETATAGDSSAYLIETLAYALERGGRLHAARAEYEALSVTRLSAIGKEGQQSTRLAPLAMARMDAQLGRVADAERQVGQFIERWPSADANLPVIMSQLARIKMLRR